MQLKSDHVISLVLLLAISATISLPCRADTDTSGAYLSTGAGLTRADSEAYRHTRMAEIAAGYNWRLLGIAAAYAHSGNYELRSDSSSYIRTSILRTQVHARLPLSSSIELQPMVGYAYWDATANLLGQEVGHEKDASFVWGIGSDARLSRNFSAGLSWLNYHDLAGTEIRTLNISLIYRIQE